MKLKFKTVRVVDSGCDHAQSDSKPPHWFRTCLKCGAVCFEKWMTHDDIMESAK